MSELVSSIDFSDIPEITDVSGGRKNPFAGRFKDGYTIIVEHQDYDEIITVTKTKRKKKNAGNSRLSGRKDKVST